MQKRMATIQKTKFESMWNKTNPNETRTRVRERKRGKNTDEINLRYLQKLGTKIKFFSSLFGWCEYESRINPMEFPLFSHCFYLSFLLVYFFFWCRIYFFPTENKYLEFDSILMHLFRWTMKYVDFAKKWQERNTKIGCFWGISSSFVWWFFTLFLSLCVFFPMIFRF